MGKVANGRGGLVVLAASALAVALSACDHAPHTSRTGIDLTVSLPGDVKVTRVDYAVGGNRIRPIVGRWIASTPQQQFERLITHIPPGEDYLVIVVAKSIDGKKTCRRETKVTVRKDALTRVLVQPPCAGGDGSIVIAVGVACTKIRLADVTASPLAASVGGTISLSATEVDSDAGTLDYEWTAQAGTFDDPRSPNTTYRCEARGHFHLNLLVVAEDICQENHDIEVDCF